ncbi:S-adenosyl-L-methionine-dependent methyltransferases superfamily protein isoform 5 [Theobroma cacao]|uniref:Methyltransferase n=1 Tax=Theobroma cacao TaxID=3641 RepID=A0A061FLA1_THECC|nr:S-adenosyl-L-methionine-dependent methyltransferases superfamily protein isoform 5 [Theobroma cacao]
MKLLGNVDFLKSPTAIKFSAFIFISVSFFYLGKHWSDGSRQLIFFSRQSPTKTTPSLASVAYSPNLNKEFNISALINTTEPETGPKPAGSVNSKENSVSVSEPAAPPPPDRIKSYGIVDENGTMSDEFEIGEFDPDLVENWGNGTEIEAETEKEDVRVTFRVKKFGLCKENMREYIPCLDNVEAIRRLKSTERGERFERHCPEKGKGLNCLVPAPKGYKPPIPWPRSRDEVWFSNVPHTRLVDDKGGQNWIARGKDKFKFPGGGTQFIHGADQYLDQISKMVPEITFGNHIRVVLDVGCGVASFGAYLLSRNVITMSIAPKDVHENQIQFALERGVPAMVAAFATRRLPYPSQAFDLIHCSRCRINWTRDDGILLLEVNRMLRAGGYFAWAAQPVYKHEEALEQQWKEMLNLTTNLCWNLVKKEGYIAIWQKPFKNSCYLSREAGTSPPLCDPDDDPDNVWYVDLKACISRLPENGYGANVVPWPARLQMPPDRLQSIQIDSYIARKELFKAESKYWNEIVASYVRALHWKKFKLRNVLDMRAGFGGCEPFDTYPRTYDFLHAAGLFSIERKRCNMSTIMLEMDRILRPGGRVYIRDSLDVMDELQDIAKAMGWHPSLRDTSEGPHASYRILTCDKRLLRG